MVVTALYNLFEPGGRPIFRKEITLKHEHIGKLLLMQNEANERNFYKSAQTLAKKLLLTLQLVRDFIFDMCSVVWTALAR